MHWLSIMPVTHALKPTFQNKLSHFFGHSSRLEKLDATNQTSCDLKTCNQSAKLQPSRAEPVVREALATNQRTINRTGSALQPLSEASTGCGNGLQPISDAATALA
jgi:hypothetical protein